MSKNMEYLLKGLTCANCASKIEKELQEFPGVSEVNLNLMTSKLSFKVNDIDSEEMTSSLTKIVKGHEPSVTIIHLNHKDSADSDSESEEKEKSLVPYIIRLCIATGIALFVSFYKLSDSIRTFVVLAAYLLSGYEVLYQAGKNILKGKVFDENFLMGFASLGAFIIGEQVEAVSVMIFYGVGELLQERAVHKSRANIAGLMDIRPDYANLKTEDQIQVVSPEQVSVGDIILVKPGEKIPLDGVVKIGSSYIDTRALTGESVPSFAESGAQVLSGTINLDGVLEIEVTKPFTEATVTKILELVQNAGSKKAKSEKFITRFARYYTPAVVFTALAVAVVPPLLGFGPFVTWIYRSLSFLIISCPCALVISIPISFFGGIGGGAKKGILIKGGSYLDALNKIHTIVFDKTGTLTKGIFEVTQVCPVGETDEATLIKIASIAEQHSTHPIARSILKFYGQNTLTDAVMEEKAGLGIIAKTGEDTIYAGNAKLMKENGIEIEEPETAASIIHIALNEKYLGYILVSDEVKEGVKEALQALKSLGVKRTVMLTGDHKNKAKEIAEAVWIDEYHAELLPQDKVSSFELIKSKMMKEDKVVFVGDGINDAPVLAGADIGIAMGGIGSDSAIEAADVVIMNDDIDKIVTAVKIARKTRRIVLQNIIFALGFKLIIMILSFLGITSIWFAIFADVGVALIALLNALRVLYMK